MSEGQVRRDGGGRYYFEEEVPDCVVRIYVRRGAVPKSFGARKWGRAGHPLRGSITTASTPNSDIHSSVCHQITLQSIQPCPSTELSDTVRVVGSEGAKISLTVSWLELLWNWSTTSPPAAGSRRRSRKRYLNEGTVFENVSLPAALVIELVYLVIMFQSTQFNDHQQKIMRLHTAPYHTSTGVPESRYNTMSAHPSIN